MSAVGTASVPTARTLRHTARALRRASGSARPIGEVLSNLYVALFAVVMAVALLGPQAGRSLGGLGSRTAQSSTPGLGTALAVAGLLAAGSSIARSLALVGPVVRDPAHVTWLLAAPVRRRGLLAPAATLVLVGGTAAGALLGLGAGLVARAALLAWGVGGAAGGLALAGLVVGAQGTRASRLVRRAADVAQALSVLILVAGLLGRVPAPRESGSARPLAVVVGATALAAALCAYVVPRRLDRLRRVELVAGAGLALGLRATVTGLDGSFVAETLRARRLLEQGSVRLRPLRGSGLTALVSADLRRTSRAPRPLVAALCATPVVWAVAELYGRVPTVIATAVLAWVAAGGVAGGLRAVTRTPAVARSLPFAGSMLRRAHAIVPAGAALVVSALAGGLAGSPGWWVLPATVIGTVGALRTAAGRPPVRWQLQATSPLGALPVGAVTSYLVGLDAVAISALPWVAGAGVLPSVAVGAIVLAILIERDPKRR